MPIDERFGVEYEDTPIGRRFFVPVEQVVEAHTTYFDAGAIRLGVEPRQLVHDGETEPWAAGGTLHVFDADSGAERLRFDCFVGFEHYHYIENDSSSVLVGYDVAANGPMARWAVAAVAERAELMLRLAGDEALAQAVATQQLEAPEVLGVALRNAEALLNGESVLR